MDYTSEERKLIHKVIMEIYSNIDQFKAYTGVEICELLLMCEGDLINKITLSMED